MTLVRWRSTK